MRGNSKKPAAASVVVSSSSSPIVDLLIADVAPAAAITNSATAFLDGFLTVPSSSSSSSVSAPPSNTSLVDTVAAVTPTTTTTASPPREWLPYVYTACRCIAMLFALFGVLQLLNITTYSGGSATATGSSSNFLGGLARQRDAFGVTITRQDYARYFAPLERHNVTLLVENMPNCGGVPLLRCLACRWSLTDCHVREPKYALRGDGAISECGPVWEKDARNVTAYMYDRNGYRLFDILYALRFHLWLSQNSGMCAMHVDVPVRACVFNGMDGDESRIFTAYNIEINERCDDRTTDWESTVLCGDRRYRVARYECALISYMDEYGRRSTKVLNEYRDVRMAQHFWDTGRGKRICDARSSEELADDLAAAMVILAKAGARVRDEQQQFIH